VQPGAKPLSLGVSASARERRLGAPSRTTGRPRSNEGARHADRDRPHYVKDTDHWLASPKREQFFGPLGITNIRTFVDPQNRSRVAVLMDVPDLDKLMAAMQTEEAAEAMEYDGVLADTLVILVEQS
jgi:hypothetical protein